ncbi:hypothetical protein BaRGS_00012209 [Batillaria attramentaria]|uniref:Uncharacterized protein n=1 Tax=Batillaria attramentaria TaxID=370345 RepID=A0ABD0LC53_9CAEN
MHPRSLWNYIPYDKTGKLPVQNFTSCGRRTKHRTTAPPSDTLSPGSEKELAESLLRSAQTHRPRTRLKTTWICKECKRKQEASYVHWRLTKGIT